MSRRFLAAFACASLAGAADVMGSIAWNGVLKSVDQLPINTKVLLGPSSSEQAFVRADGTFVIHDVAPGSYVLSVATPKFIFNRLRVDVSSDASATPVVTVLDHRFSRPPPVSPHSALARGELALPYPVQLVALAEPNYYPTPQGFHPLKMLTANPMYLLMGAMVLVTFLLPKLIGYMDPEALEEMQKNQAAMQKSMGDLQSGNFSSAFAKILEGGADSDGKEVAPAPAPPEAKPAPKPQASSSGVRSSGQGKKRR